MNALEHSVCVKPEESMNEISNGTQFSVQFFSQTIHIIRTWDQKLSFTVRENIREGRLTAWEYPQYRLARRFSKSQRQSERNG